MLIEDAEVSRHDALSGVYRLIVLECAGVAAAARPGQFVHLRVPRLEAASLRRPFSICSAEDERISILYKPVGRGTRLMTDLAQGETVSLMGPLGNGFPEPSQGSVPALVAGGYGVGPLYFLASRLSCRGVVFVGGAGRDDILCADEFKDMGWDVRITTEDGSMGVQGLVSEALVEWLQANKDGGIELFACGPDGMLRAVGMEAGRNSIKAWLSLDRRMGCGIGACLACVQKILLPDGSAKFLRVCRDGPVFDSASVVWGAK